MLRTLLSVPATCRTLAAVAACLVAATGPGGSTGVQTRIPVACSVEATYQVVRFTPLVIDATVHQKCNTTHDLNVTYRPEVLSRPRLLQISLAGAAPDFNAPGSARFANLPYTDSVKRLRITYGGPRPERQQMMQTLRIAISY